MKRIVFVLLTILLSLSLISCTSQPDSNSDNDSDTPKTEELVWPKDDLPNDVPKPKGIIITEIIDNDDSILITFTDCDQDEMKWYMNQISKNDWEFSTTNTEIGKTITSIKENRTLIFISSPYDQTGSVEYISVD